MWCVIVVQLECQCRKNVMNSDDQHKLMHTTVSECGSTHS